MVHTKGEGRGPNGQRKILFKNFSCLAIKYELYFIRPLGPPPADMANIWSSLFFPVPFSLDHRDQSAFLSQAEESQSSETPFMEPSADKIWGWAVSLWPLCPHLSLKPTALMGLMLGTSLRTTLPGYPIPFPLLLKCTFSEACLNPVNELMLMRK